MKQIVTSGAASLALLSSSVQAGTFRVSPGGDDAGNGTDAPWRTLRHALGALPTGETTLELAPGTYHEERGLDFSRLAATNLTIRSVDPTNPSVITCSGSGSVFRVAGAMDGGTLTFRDVAILQTNTAVLARIEVQNLNLRFDRCSLTGGSAILETAARSTGVKINFHQSFVGSVREGLRIHAAAEITLTECSLTWDGGAFVQGVDSLNVFGRVSFEKCSFSGTPSALLFAAVNPGRYHTDLLKVSGCTGTCGRLAWEQGGHREWRVEDNDIRWTYQGTVPVGAGIEVRNGQTRPVVNPAPFEKIVIARNIFRFADGTTHPIFLGKGADRTKFVHNVLICPNGGKFGVVVKSDHNLFEFNSIYAGRNAFYLAGASHNTVRHNTIYSYASPALLIDANQERTIAPAGTHGQALSNTIHANILVGTRGPAFMHDGAADDNSRSWNTSCNDNIYWSLAGEAAVSLNAVALPQTNGIAAVQAGWAQYGETDAMRLNDRTSVIADPRLSHPPEDFSLTPESPVLHRRGTSGLNAGAWQDSSAGASEQNHR